MADLFQRRCAVVLAGSRIEGLDVEFRVDKSIKPEPNKAKIEVYNLNPDHRSALQRDGKIPVQLEVGYGEDPLSLLFVGDVRRGYSIYEPPDWRTTLDTNDGEEAIKTARLAKSYGPGTAIETVIKDAVDAMGVGVGNSLTQASGALMRGDLSQFANGKVLSGAVYPQLVRIFRGVGKEVSIQDGNLQVTDLGVALSGTAVLLSPDTGLIGSPEPGKDGRIKARALLQPEIFPGRKVEIRSRQTKGFYRAESCSYVGQTSGRDWYVDIEARGIDA